MKNITLSASETLIERARQKAQSENTTLNSKFREWLGQYTHESFMDEDVLNDFFSKFKTKTGGPFTRDQMNERG